MILLIKVYNLEQREKLEEHYYKYDGNGMQREVKMQDAYAYLKQLRSLGIEKVEVIF